MSRRSDIAILGAHSPDSLLALYASRSARCNFKMVRMIFVGLSALCIDWRFGCLALFR